MPPGQRAEADSAAAADENAVTRSATQDWLHDLFEDPGSSWAATCIAVFVFGCILASTVAFCVESVPAYSGYHDFWLKCEIFFVAVFTGEYVVRFYATKMSKFEFVTDPFNVIDLLAILPFYVEYFMHSSVIDLRFLRIARLVRLFRIGKYSSGCRLIVSAMASSKEALVMLVFVIGVTTIFLSSLMYTLEQGVWDEKMGCYVREGETICSPFQSIPETCYWAITTITTVGYGDVLPTTNASKVLAGMSMLIGILVLALPVTAIGVSFSEAYANIKEQEKIQEAHEELTHEGEIDDHIRSTVQELQLLKQHSKAIVTNIGRMLAEDIVRVEGVSAQEAELRLSPHYEMMSEAALISVDDLESQVHTLLLAEEGAV